MSMKASCEALERVADKRHARFMGQGYSESDAADAVAEFLRGRETSYRAKDCINYANFIGQIAEAYEFTLWRAA